MEEERKSFWTKGRRRALSSTSLTVFQILVGGAVISGVFGRLEGLWPKGLFVSGVALVLVLGIVMAPDNGGK